MAGAVAGYVPSRDCKKRENADYPKVINGTCHRISEYVGPSPRLRRANTIRERGVRGSNSATAEKIYRCKKRHMALFKEDRYWSLQDLGIAWSVDGLVWLL